MGVVGERKVRLRYIRQGRIKGASSLSYIRVKEGGVWVARKTKPSAGVTISDL
ncbi:hypothetical protein JCM9157_600 [Halalkalibacter akibai JCM 9157]|uniref:Uncharacterized protein n=1 Tax=Halalkalibacter akibai (strain ATCC 43226 / DSM 21942 / CIP 109018 / JCM 9157 / 1139) TaxID=1236973 RepID=W4QNA4_HALA3|nr:hypothetical protein JCM9157_600 [Halalkalibacter akibai JCM 9157]